MLCAPMLHLLTRLALSLVLLPLALRAQDAATKPGYLTGQATRADGRPLGGVQLRIFGTTDVGQRSSLDARTKADGTFSVRLPSGNFSLRDALWPVNINGRPYRLPLYLSGEDNSDFDSTEGATAQLVLRMSGKISAEKPDADENAWFGGTIELEWIGSDGRTADKLPENAQLEVRLTPTSPLFDGTASTPVVHTRTLSWARANRIISDVPLADYEVRVALKTAGQTTPLLVASREAMASAQRTPLGEQAPIRFAPRSGSTPLLTGNGIEKCVLQVVLPALSPVGTATTPASQTTPPAANAAWPVGTHLNVLRSPYLGQWHPGTIKAIKPGLYLIKFDAFGEEFNEWVDASRLKPL